jgi:hypothetical protein
MLQVSNFYRYVHLVNTTRKRISCGFYISHECGVRWNIIFPFGNALLVCFLLYDGTRQNSFPDEVITHKLAISVIALLMHISFRYSIPGVFPEGAEAWDCVWDVVVSAFCHPCSVAQVFPHT